MSEVDRNSRLFEIVLDTYLRYGSSPEAVTDAVAAEFVPRAALDAAQDEIERCIEERESQRLLIRQLGAALECVAPAAARLILGGAS